MEDFNKAINSFLQNGNIDIDWLINDVELHITNIYPIYQLLIDTKVSAKEVALSALTSTLNDRLDKPTLSNESVEQSFKDLEMSIDDVLSPVIDYVNELREDYTETDKLDESIDTDDLILNIIDEVTKDNLENGLVSESDFVLQCYDKYFYITGNTSIPSNIKLDLQQCAKQAYERLVNNDLDENKNKQVVTESEDENIEDLDNQYKEQSTDIKEEDINNQYNSIWVIYNSNTVYNEYFNLKAPTSEAELKQLKQDIINGKYYIVDIAKVLDAEPIKDLKNLKAPVFKMFIDGDNDEEDDLEESKKVEEYTLDDEEQEARNEMIKELIKSGMSKEQAEDTYKYVYDLIDNQVKSIDKDSKLIKEDIKDYQGKMSIDYMSKIFNKMRKNGWNGDIKTADKYFDDVINKDTENSDSEATEDIVTTLMKRKESINNLISKYTEFGDMKKVDDLKKQLNQVETDIYNYSNPDKPMKKIQESRNIIWTDSFNMTDEELQQAYNEYVENEQLDGEEPMEYDDWLPSFMESEHESVADSIMAEYDDVVVPMIFNQCNDDTLILVASIERWNGTFTGAKIISTTPSELNDILSEYDEVTFLDTDEGVVIEGVHHDGTNYLHLYTLPENVAPLAKAMGYDKYSKESYTDEEIEKGGGLDIVMSDDLLSDIAMRYVDESELAKHTDLLVPIKNTLQTIRENLTESEDNEFLTPREKQIFDKLKNTEDLQPNGIQSDIDERVGQKLSIGEFNTLLQSLFGKYNEVFLQANELYNKDPNEEQELIVWDDNDMYTITYEIVDELSGTIKITGVTSE